MLVLSLSFIAVLKCIVQSSASSGTVDYTLFVAALIPVDVCPVLEDIGSIAVSL